MQSGSCFVYRIVKNLLVQTDLKTDAQWQSYHRPKKMKQSILLEFHCMHACNLLWREKWFLFRMHAICCTALRGRGGPAGSRHRLWSGSASPRARPRRGTGKRFPTTQRIPFPVFALFTFHFRPPAGHALHPAPPTTKRTQRTTEYRRSISDSR